MKNNNNDYKKKGKTGILLHIQLLSIWDSLTHLGKGKKIKSILYVVLFIYAIGCMGVILAMGFDSISVICKYDLGWLYFALVGISALALSLFGTTMMAESMIFSPKDNDILLPMPIAPSAIFSSRMSIIAITNCLLTTFIMVLAAVMAGKYIQYSLNSILGILIGIIGITIIAQALVCLCAWILHLLLSKLSPAIGSLVFVTAFFILYFKALGSGNQWLASLVSGSNQLGQSVKSFAWPLYAMGLGCEGNIKYIGLFALCSLVIFIITWAIMSNSFMKLVTLSGDGTKLNRAKTRKGQETDLRLEEPKKYSRKSIRNSIAVKEFRHFINSSVYLTNMGFGVVLMIIATAASVMYKDKFVELIQSTGLPTGLMPLAIYYVLGFMVATNVTTAPNISLEGNNLWILKSFPVSPMNVLMGKLRFHFVLMVPVSMISTIVIPISLGCAIMEMIVLLINVAAYIFLCGVFGLMVNLKNPRFDWSSEVVPCKQSISTLITMLLMYGFLLLSFAVYFFIFKEQGFLVSYGVYGIFLLAVCGFEYRRLKVRGTKLWEKLEV